MHLPYVAQLLQVDYFETKRRRVVHCTERFAIGSNKKQAGSKRYFKKCTLAYRNEKFLKEALFTYLLKAPQQLGHIH